MAGRLQLRGLYVRIVASFDERGEVAVDALERLADDLLADDLLAAGAAGIVVLATTGEPSSLDEAERDAVVAACGRVCADRRQALIVGAGTNDTRTTVARHEALADLPWVTASLAVVPYYVRPTKAAIVAHLQCAAARSPVPVVVYNVPYRTGRGLGAPALLELAGTDNIAGLKQPRRLHRRRHPDGPGRGAGRLRRARRRRPLPVPLDAHGQPEPSPPPRTCAPGASRP